MDRALDSLSSAFKPKVFELLARLTERRVPVMIIQTSRTLAEHRVNLIAGTSRTPLSKHLPRRERGFGEAGPDADKADAIDLCPWALYDVAGPDKLAWNEYANAETVRAWTAIMEVAESLGLRSGARWHDPHDPGHVEYVFPIPSTPVVNV